MSNDLNILVVYYSRDGHVQAMAEHIATGRVPTVMEPFLPGRFRSDRMVPDAASAGTH